jgi:hypothetical protein
MKVDINGLSFEKTTSIQVDVLNGFNNGFGTEHFFQALALGSPTSWPAQLPTFTYPEMFIAFWETAPPFDLLSSDALPSSIDFSRADTEFAYVRAGTGSTNMYEIQFSLSQVPEPKAAPLVTAGFLLSWLWSLARRSKSMSV